MTRRVNSDRESLTTVANTIHRIVSQLVVRESGCPECRAAIRHLQHALNLLDVKEFSAVGRPAREKEPGMQVSELATCMNRLQSAGEKRHLPGDIIREVMAEILEASTRLGTLQIRETKAQR